MAKKLSLIEEIVKNQAKDTNTDIEVSQFLPRIHHRVAQWYKHLPPTQKIGVQIRSEAGRPGHQAVIGTGVILVIMLGGYQ